MSTHHPIAAARRRAKSLSRDGSMSHQKALDLIARENGSAHWAAYCATQAERQRSETLPIAQDMQRSTMPDWRVVQMDRMLGSRHSPADEWCIRRIGAPIAIISERLGSHGLLVMTTIMHIIAMMSSWWIGRDPAMMMLGVMALMVAPVTTAMNLGAPDREKQRGGRRTTLSFMALWTVISMAVVLQAVTTDHLRIEWRAATSEPKPNLMVLSLWPTIIAFHATQCAAAWLGRKRRRDR